MFHFSLANPIGTRKEDVPRLLRRLAKSITELGPIEIHDITYHAEVLADGSTWPSMTVYYDLPSSSRTRSKRTTDDVR
jgi:hypothetical protein